jgi:asparagine synthase (glutamine-hydrolysing)
MRRYLPDDILFRPKQGSVTPIAQWLRGPLAAEARKLLHKRKMVEGRWGAPDG